MSKSDKRDEATLNREIVKAMLLAEYELLGNMPEGVAFSLEAFIDRTMCDSDAAVAHIKRIGKELLDARFGTDTEDSEKDSPP